MIPPINFQQWIEDHSDLLKPPVCNQVVYENTDFIIMVVGGPNTRKDYHVNQGEEFFYQIENSMTLKVAKKIKNTQNQLVTTIDDIEIKPGHIFLLPPTVPHSPQRTANSVGLVIERKREISEQDGFQWYCDECHHLLYEEFLHISDIVSQLPEIFERFQSKEENRICQQCGFKNV